MTEVSKIITSKSFEEGVKTYLVEYGKWVNGWEEIRQRFVIADNKEEAADAVKKEKFNDVRVASVRRLKFGDEVEFNYKYCCYPDQDSDIFRKEGSVG